MLKNVLKTVLVPIGKGLLIFATFGLALYAYAVIDFPDDAPGEASGVLGVYVGTASQTDGDLDGTTGYNRANTRCAGDSHVCSIQEIVNSYNHGISGLPTAGIMWVTNGPTFSGANIANDCSGWTTAAGVDLGTIWFFGTGNGYSGITPCSLEYQFACCR